MLVEKITSRQNPLVKRFRRVRVTGERHHVFLEGVRLIEDALGAGAHFESLAYSSEIESTERGLALLDALQKVPCRGAQVTRQVMQAIADTESPQGIVAIATRPYYDLEEVFNQSPQLIIIADRLQDPGNLGTIIRTAEAAGATALITTHDTVDPFNQKSLRASMGSAFRLPVVTNAQPLDIFSICRNRKMKIIASGPARERNAPAIEDTDRIKPVLAHTQVDLTMPVALILGREASGLADDLRSNVDGFVYIPMAGKIESLNVAAAAAVLLYEAARQRDFASTKAKTEKGRKKKGERGKGRKDAEPV
jgi:TrmH family RNA methyltransferase